MNIKTLLEGVLQLVKLPPRQLVVGILILSNLAWGWVFIESSSHHKTVLDESTRKLDSCSENRSRDMRRMYERSDSIIAARNKLIEEILVRQNEEYKDALKQSQETKKIVKKVVNNLKSR